jgi:uncharacterized membrane protein
MTRRLYALDVARGAAMLFVCLSHFGGTFLNPGKNADISPLLARIGGLATRISMIATPSFMVVSGCVIGCLYTLDPERMPALRRKLLDRGLFLLLVGHTLQAPAYASSGHLGVELRVSYITDVIAIAIIIGPTLVSRTSQLTRMSIGALLLVLSWGIDGWGPRSAVGIFFDRYAFGVAPVGEFAGFPVVPWLGVYLLATVLGERIGRSAQSGGREIEHLLARIGGVLVGCGILAGLVIALIAVRQPRWSSTLPAHHALLHAFTGTLKKYPPGPVYLAIYAGAALLLIATAFVIVGDSRCSAVTRHLAALGRASFFIFVLQAYVYYVALPSIHIPYPALWPVYYALTVIAFVWVSRIWNRFDANRFLSVGLWRTVPFARAVRARMRTGFALPGADGS